MERLEAGKSHLNLPPLRVRTPASAGQIQTEGAQLRLRGRVAAGTPRQPDACHSSLCSNRGNSESDQSGHSREKCNEAQFSERMKDGPRSKAGEGCAPLPERPGQPGDCSAALVLSTEHQGHIHAGVRGRPHGPEPLLGHNSAAQLQGHITGELPTGIVVATGQNDFGYEIGPTAKRAAEGNYVFSEMSPAFTGLKYY